MTHNLFARSFRLGMVNVFFEGEEEKKEEQKTFTQDDVNRMISTRITEEHTKYKTQSDKTISDLKKLQQQASTTEEQKNQLQLQIDNLTAQFTTKEQQLEKKAQEWEEKYKNDLQGLQQQAGTWKSRYEGNLKNVAIVNAATQHKAFNPSQIESILAPITKVVEEAGSDGKPTGNFVPVVSWQSKDKEGKPVQLQLSVTDAVKAMTETPDLYGNLFRSEASGGLGGGTTGGRGTPSSFTAADVESMDMESYVKNRDSILKS